MKTAEFFRKISIIHWAQAAGLVIVSIIAYSLAVNNGGYLHEWGPAGLLESGLFVCVLSCVSIGQILYRKILNGPNPGDSLKSKLKSYRTALVVRSALFEFAGVVTGVTVILSGQITLLILMLAILVIFYLFRPTAFQIVTDLRLSDREIRKLENPDGMIE